MKKFILRMLADYLYMRAGKYAQTLKVFENQKDWMKYIRNTGSICMRRDRCLKLAERFIKMTEK